MNLALRWIPNTEEPEKDVLYVLNYKGKTLRLPMPPSLAAKINASRKKRGFEGLWEPQPESGWGLWDINPAATPPWVINLLVRIQNEDKRHNSAQEVDSAN